MDFSVESMKIVMAASIQIIDLFLVATVFYVVSLGFYELFIAKAPLPGWLKICNLDDLKTKVLGLVIIALSVLFLGAALTWEGTPISLHSVSRHPPGLLLLRSTSG